MPSLSQGRRRHVWYAGGESGIPWLLYEGLGLGPRHHGGTPVVGTGGGTPGTGTPVVPRDVGRLWPLLATAGLLSPFLLEEPKESEPALLLLPLWDDEIDSAG